MQAANTLFCVEEKVGVTKYRQTADAIRKFITSSAIKAGDEIPPYRDLAVRLKTSEGTIHRALGILEKEGMLQRRQGRGTFVADRLATGEIAIVTTASLMSPELGPYYRIASNALLENMKIRNSGWNLRVHVGTFGAVATDFPKRLDLLDPDVARRLRGVFTFHALYDLETELYARQIPVVALSVATDADVMRQDGVRHCVWFDLQTIYELGIPLLREAGCRSVGVIWGCNKEKTWTEHSFYRVFAPILRTHGLESRTEWIEPFSDAATERTGYEAFMRLWQRTPRPDGILVNDDVVCQGVLRAALHLGIDIPGQLRLVSQASRGVEFPYHKPITRVEFDPVEQARLAADMMETLLRGGTPSTAYVRLSGTARKGETT